MAILRYFIALLTILSLLLCIASGWCWQRSYQIVDIISKDRVGTVLQMRGVGSYRGALLIGTVDKPPLSTPNLEINRRVMEMPKNRTKVTSTVGERKDFLGFGRVEGRMPTPVMGGLFTAYLPYRAYYIPYYFFMLMSAPLPIWALVRLCKRIYFARAAKRFEVVGASDELVQVTTGESTQHENV